MALTPSSNHLEYCILDSITNNCIVLCAGHNSKSFTLFGLDEPDTIILAIYYVDTVAESC